MPIVIDKNWLKHEYKFFVLLEGTRSTRKFGAHSSEKH